MENIMTKQTKFEKLIDEVINGNDALGELGYRTRSSTDELIHYSESRIDDKLELHIDLPGLDKNEIQIEVIDGRLVILSNREKPIGLGYTTNKYGNYKCVYEIPQKYDHDSIEVTYKNGVLIISIQEVKTKKIKIGIK